MSFAGFKKQLNKANQIISETVGTAEATKFDSEYNELERKVDVTAEFVNNFLSGVHEFLVPNPMIRARMATKESFMKVKGTPKSSSYPQPQTPLAEMLTKYGYLLGTDSDLGKALCEVSEAYRQIVDLKDHMDDSIKHNVLEPLSHLLQVEIREISQHRAKLRSRRLDYDGKKRKQTTRDEELIQAEEKLEESKKLAETTMYNLLSNDIEQVAQLQVFASAQLAFHHGCVDVLSRLEQNLSEQISEASKRARQEHIVKPVLLSMSRPGDGQSSNALRTAISSPTPQFSEQPSAPMRTSVTPTAPKPSCKALYDFEPLNPGELGFKEGEIIEITKRIDENWYEGTLHGRIGIFPTNYVEPLVPFVG